MGALIIDNSDTITTGASQIYFVNLPRAYALGYSISPLGG